LSQRTLNLGILAHVDAGKTTLTERLLFTAGVIGELGSVDAGTTQTDSLALERQRGITIRSAVTSFAVGDLTVNLIDTPGHPDFIAEVERVLSVLDGAVLVISAVEGVQPQTRVLMRALQRLGIPVLLFVNKIDRPGATEGRVLKAITERVSSAAIPMGFTSQLGRRDAAFTPWDERDIAASQVRTQVRRGLVHPVFFGSAATGAGVPHLMASLAGLLPTTTGDATGLVSGRVFKIERGPGGEKVAYVRMFSGTVRTRDRLQTGAGRDAKVTAISVFERGPAVPRASVSAGQIGQLHGLDGIRVGDDIGASRGIAGLQFAPPALEAVITACHRGGRAALRAALGQLAEQDPLINVRQSGGEVSVSLYGEVQKEVIAATLASDFGVEVRFRETTVIYIERVAGTGAATEVLGAPGNPFPATLGLRLDPAPAGSGVAFRLDVDVRSVPLYVYKTTGNFAAMMTRYVRQALEHGPRGWRVTDCLVTLTECGYVSPSTTAAHFRKLTPLVLLAALDQAGTHVCEPLTRLSLEIPDGTVSAVLSAAARLGGTAGPPVPHGDLVALEIELPAAQTQRLQRLLPGLTSGEGVAEPSFGGYRPLRGRPSRAASVPGQAESDRGRHPSVRHAPGR
jgi:ribosomal protection tetracycline resistance protein